MPDYSQQNAERYYIKRVEHLCKMQEDIPDANKIFLLSEQLAESLEEILERITRFLVMRSPLQNGYEVRSWVGRRAVGDGSRNIRIGKFDKKLPSTIQERQVESYDPRCDEVFQRYSVLVHAGSEPRGVGAT